MKKLFSFKVAKRAIIISMILMILVIIFISCTYRPDPDERSEEFPILFAMLFYSFTYFADQVLLLKIEIVRIVEWLSPLLVVIAATIKIIDYKSVISNYPSNAINSKHKIACILGIIAIPAWTVITGFVFYYFGAYMTDYVLDISYKEGYGYRLLSFIIMLVCFVLPTLCVFVYSLVLDILGLRSKSV